MAKKKVRDRSPAPVTGAAARAAADLEALGARFALVGGLAVSAWSEPRYTRDVDLVVAVGSDEEAEQVIRSLIARGYELVTVIEQTKTARLATARLRRRERHGVLIDLLFASSGIEREIAETARLIDNIPVAQVGVLLALKALSESERRLQDRIDIQELAKIATLEDWRIAMSLAQLIKDRGYHRGRALLTRLRNWRSSKKQRKGS
jgi:hypothetical protein